MVENPLALVGKTVNIQSYKGEYREEFGRVMEVRDTFEKPLCWKTCRGMKIHRSRFAITVWMTSKGEYRTFYHAYVNMVEVV